MKHKLLLCLAGATLLTSATSATAATMVIKADPIGTNSEALNNPASNTMTFTNPGNVQSIIATGSIEWNFRGGPVQIAEFDFGTGNAANVYFVSNTTTNKNGGPVKTNGDPFSGKENVMATLDNAATSFTYKVTIEGPDSQVDHPDTAGIDPTITITYTPPAGPMPEPAIWMMMLMGVAATGGTLRARRSHTEPDRQLAI